MFRGRSPTELIDALDAVLRRHEDAGYSKRRISAHSLIPRYYGAGKCTQQAKLDKIRTA